jgi:hypothetical protein
VNRTLFVSTLVVAVIAISLQTQAQEADTSAITRILDQGTGHSRVMEFLSALTDRGPRLTASPGFKRAAEWAREELTRIGLENSRLEGWGPFGRGWELKRFSAHVLAGQPFPLIAYPKAWSPGTRGTVAGDVVYLDAKSDSALDTWRGKLRGRFVLMGEPRDLTAHFSPEATRSTDTELLELANAPMPEERRKFRREPSASRRDRSLLEFRKNRMAIEEEALAILTPSRGDGGNVFVQGASVPQHPDTPATRRGSPWDAKAPDILPQVAVGAEHYNRMVRLLEQGQPVRMEMNLDVTFSKVDSGYNVLAELPGTDLKDEIVMLGAHLDSWHGGTGATDNGTGVAVCMEAMRIIRDAGLHPRRTIRIALWGGEEQGVNGSEEYVKRYLGEVTGPDTNRITRHKPAAEKFSVYFNNDNGTGKVRGVYMQGNESVRPIFREWLKPFGDMGASTLTLSSTGGSDHMSFDAIGLPGFQFIQDDIEYFTRTWHSTMDVYDRAQVEDLKQSSMIMAAFVYNAAMRDERMPRKPRKNVLLEWAPQINSTDGK